ncbi:MAG: hypothetical protein ABS43_15320 [Bordetella sp. SCN 67-23]|mgnify:CR=1 FL=1|nr:MaoC family dehydratase N-terminal domain-containing protein [Burkholderiales bacterium]ODS72930.1 MAG: hypothetical protein ABS43_15320 [Bordetella sp. SCN 67-23]ODU95707.1 MAG: hypothetical protein ABT00_03310 [Bordetella sp. SCN 68-11]OJW93517.1 MAG: hypothetical protein BGO71_16250 [Burkholderiales bacterium 67-32]
MYVNAKGDIQLDITPGEIFRCPSRTLTDAHFLLFSSVSCDVHPIHYDAEYAGRTRFGKPLVHGLLLASITALGSSSGQGKAHGFIFVEQGCRYLKPAAVGDTVHPSLTVERLWEEDQRTFCRLSTTVLNQHGEQLLEGFHLYRVLPLTPHLDSGDD